MADRWSAQSMHDRRSQGWHIGHPMSLQASAFINAPCDTAARADSHSLDIRGECKLMPQACKEILAGTAICLWGMIGRGRCCAANFCLNRVTSHELTICTFWIAGVQGNTWTTDSPPHQIHSRAQPRTTTSRWFRTAYPIVFLPTWIQHTFLP